MNRRQWLGYVLAATPLLCLPVPVTDFSTSLTSTQLKVRPVDDGTKE